MQIQNINAMLRDRNAFFIPRYQKLGKIKCFFNFVSTQQTHDVGTTPLFS